jgi:hypothetical protein
VTLTQGGYRGRRAGLVREAGGADRQGVDDCVGMLPGVGVSRASEPVIWALIDAVAGVLGQPSPTGLRIIATGEARAIETSGGPDGRCDSLLVIPLAYVLGLSCAELKVVIARELAVGSGGQRLRLVSRTLDRLGRGLVEIERRGSRLRRPLRRPGRTIFGLNARLACGRAERGDATAVGLYGSELVASVGRRTEAVAIAFDWFRAVELQPLLDRGWRPPVGPGFRSFLDAPLVRERLAGIASGDADGGSTGDLLISADAIEAGLLGASGRGQVGVGWQEGSARVLLSVWDGHVRRHAGSLDGVCVRELGQVLAASIEAFGGGQGRVETELAGLGSAFALALAGDGWAIGRLPGRGSVLRKDGVTLRPDEEIARLRDGAITPEIWADRCERLGIADLQLTSGDREAGGVIFRDPLAFRDRLGSRAR